MSSATTNPTSACARCNKATARSCTGCKDAPTETGQIGTSTFYCSTECQKADWTNHKELCKILQSRKIVYRAGSILQEMFYVYREKTFDLLIERIEERAGRLYVHEGIRDSVLTDTLIPFPSEMIPNEQDKKGILSYMSCFEAVGWMHDIIRYLLMGHCNISEVSFSPKNHKREVVWIDNKGNNHSFPPSAHDIVLVTLKNGGEKYAVDLSGAQYGHYEAVLPWSEYYTSRVQSLCLMAIENGDKDNLFQKFGQNKKSLLERRFGPGLEGTMAVFNENASRILKDGTMNWEKERKLTVQNMLKLPRNKFELRKKELVDHISASLQRHQDESEEARKYFIRLGRHMGQHQQGQ